MSEGTKVFNPLEESHKNNKNFQDIYDCLVAQNENNELLLEIIIRLQERVNVLEAFQEAGETYGGYN